MLKRKDTEVHLSRGISKLNGVTTRDAYSLHWITKTEPRVSKAIYKTLEQDSALWQTVEMLGSTKNRFVSEVKSFEGKRKPFCVCNATSTFQKSMKK